MGYEFIFYECLFIENFQREKVSYFGAHFFSGSSVLTGENNNNEVLFGSKALG